VRRRSLPLIVAIASLLAVLPCVTRASETAAGDSAQEAEVAGDSSAAKPEVILYYFHRTLRCQTCLTMEAWIDEAVQTHFAGALKGGRLLWRPANIEEPENMHFEGDFDLEFNSAVLVRTHGDEESSWENLEELWDLLEEKPQFLEYVWAHVAGALDSLPAKGPPLH